MDILTFFSNLVESLAWPITAIVITFLLKDSIGTLLPNMSRLRYKDFELEFQKLESKAKQIEPPPSKTEKVPVVVANKPFAEYVAELAEISPRSAIVEAWRAVEAAMKDVVGDEEAIRRSLFNTINELVSRKILSPQSGELIHELRNIRNKAVHAGEFDLTVEQALSYGIAAESIIRILKNKSGSGG